MTSSSSRGATWFILFLLTVALLVGIGPVRSEQVAAQSELPNEDEDYSSPLYPFQFQRTRKGSNWILKYRFKDFLGQWKEASCAINMITSSQAHYSYGFSDEEKSQGILKKFQEVIREELAKRDFRPYFGDLTISYDKNNANFVPGWIFNGKRFVNSPGKPLSAQWENAYKERDTFYRWYGENSNSSLGEACRRFMVDRGFMFSDSEDKWVANYSDIVDRAMAVLPDCANALNEATGGDPETLMQFFQWMPYTELSERDATTGRVIWGLLVPSSVLIKNGGDCDSKSLAYCVIQRSTLRELIILRSFRPAGDTRPAHALVGVETWPDPKPTPKTQEVKQVQAWQKTSLDAVINDDLIQFGNRYFVPCEVAAPGPRFGTVASPKTDYYLIIPIRSLE